MLLKNGFGCYLFSLLIFCGVFIHSANADESPFEDVDEVIVELQAARQVNTEGADLIREHLNALESDLRLIQKEGQKDSADVRQKINELELLISTLSATLKKMNEVEITNLPEMIQTELHNKDFEKANEYVNQIVNLKTLGLVVSQYYNRNSMMYEDALKFCLHIKNTPQAIYALRRLKNETLSAKQDMDYEAIALGFLTKQITNSFNNKVFDISVPINVYKVDPDIGMILLNTLKDDLQNGKYYVAEDKWMAQLQLLTRGVYDVIIHSQCAISLFDNMPDEFLPKMKKIVATMKLTRPSDNTEKQVVNRLNSMFLAYIQDTSTLKEISSCQKAMQYYGMKTAPK